MKDKIVAKEEQEKYEVEQFLSKGIVIHPSSEKESMSIARGLLGA
ncbi:MAG: hypothetical protein WC976_06040 [Caldisericia bacterium]